MKSSTSIVNLSKALLIAQSQMGAASKSAANPFFKSKYADLPSVMEVVKGPLNSAGIVVLQVPNLVGVEFGHPAKNVISTTLIHSESGEWITSDTEVVVAKQNDPQSFGAAQTYARRFGLQSMLFIPAEDDDGETAMGRGYQKPAYQSQKPGTSTGVKAIGAVNAEFDKILPPVGATSDNPNPTTTASQVVVGGTTQTSVAPLKKSTFKSKAAKAAAVETPATASTTTIADSGYEGM